MSCIEVNSRLGWCGVRIWRRLSMLLRPRRILAISLLVRVSSGMMGLIALIMALRWCMGLRGRLVWRLRVARI